VNKLRRFRVTFTAVPENMSVSVELSEIQEARDLETLFHEVVDWAKRQGWYPRRIEELEEPRT